MEEIFSDSARKLAAVDSVVHTFNLQDCLKGHLLEEITLLTHL
jgi:hypothetical protein